MPSETLPQSRSSPFRSGVPDGARRGSEPLVCVGICTARRPLLLSKCLESLRRQRPPSGAGMIFVVVDNDSTPGAQATVAAEAGISPFPIRYLHEPRRGISYARNRVLTEALALGTEWVAFIDDDETAAPDWVDKLLAAARRHRADVIQGPVEPCYPTPLPFWASPPPPAFAEGDPMKFAATGNVLFRTSLIRADGFGLRFDEGMALSGGEDTEFFLRAGLQGARIVYSAQPRVTEEVPLARLTFRRQMKTAFRTAANDVYIKTKLYGSARLFLRRLPQVLLRLVRGAVLIAASPFFAILGLAKFKTIALAGGRNIFKSLGVLAGLMSVRPRPYRKTDGY